MAPPDLPSKKSEGKTILPPLERERRCMRRRLDAHAYIIVRPFFQARSASYFRTLPSQRPLPRLFTAPEGMSRERKSNKDAERRPACMPEEGARRKVAADGEEGEAGLAQRVLRK